MFFTNLKTITVFAVVISGMIVVASTPTFVDFFARPADAHKLVQFQTTRFARRPGA